MTGPKIINRYRAVHGCLLLRYYYGRWVNGSTCLTTLAFGFLVNKEGIVPTYVTQSATLTVSWTNSQRFEIMG